MNDEISELVKKYEQQNKEGRELYNELIRKYVNRQTMGKAFDFLKIEKEGQKYILESEMEQLYITDFVLHELKLPVSTTFRQKIEAKGKTLEKDKISIIERYLLINEFDNNLRVEILQGMIDSKMALLEVIDVNPPMITLNNLLFDTPSVDIIDLNLSQTIQKGMIAGMRLKTIQSLTSSGGIIFLFKPSDKKWILKQWEQLQQKRSKTPYNTLMFYFLFHLHRKIGLPTVSEVFLD